MVLEINESVIVDITMCSCKTSVKQQIHHIQNIQVVVYKCEKVHIFMYTFLNRSTQ